MIKNKITFFIKESLFLRKVIMYEYFQISLKPFQGGIV